MASCENCRQQYRSVTDRIVIQDKYFGEFRTSRVKFSQCEGCGNIMFTPQALKIIDKTKLNRKIYLINRQPIGEFISSSETAKILKISRQALHKNLIIGGRVFRTLIGGKYYYLKKSVMRFKKRKEGRYPLVRNSFSQIKFIPFNKQENVKEFSIDWQKLDKEWDFYNRLRESTPYNYLPGTPPAKGIRLKHPGRFSDESK